MSRRENDPGGRGAKPEDVPSPGKRPIEAEGSWFDSISARPAARLTGSESSSTAPIDPELFDRGALLSSPPSGARAGDAATLAGPRIEVRRRAGSRIRSNLTYVDPLSVLKVSVIIYAVLLVLWLLVVALLFSFIDGLGFFDSVNDTLLDLGEDPFEITLGSVERWALIIGIVVAVAGSVFNVFLALVYNLMARFLGGIEVGIEER